MKSHQIGHRRQKKKFAEAAVAGAGAGKLQLKLPSLKLVQKQQLEHLNDTQPDSELPQAEDISMDEADDIEDDGIHSEATEDPTLSRLESQI